MDGCMDRHTHAHACMGWREESGPGGQVGRVGFSKKLTTLHRNHIPLKKNSFLHMETSLFYKFILNIWHFIRWNNCDSEPECLIINNIVLFNKQSCSPRKFCYLSTRGGKCNLYQDKWYISLYKRATGYVKPGNHMYLINSFANEPSRVYILQLQHNLNVYSHLGQLCFLLFTFCIQMCSRINTAHFLSASFVCIHHPMIGLVNLSYFSC